MRLPPTNGQLPDTDFDTLWTAIFTLDPKVNKEKEIWFIQDVEEEEEEAADAEPVVSNSTNSTGNDTDPVVNLVDNGNSTDADADADADTDVPVPASTDDKTGNRRLLMSEEEMFEEPEF